MNCDGILPNVDNDEDGYISCEDCNDEDAEVYPGAFDLPGDGIDADCDGVDPDADLPPNNEDLKVIVGSGGCACDSTSPWGLSWMWVLPMLLIARRRDHGQYRTA